MITDIIKVSWISIDCIERNGLITNYIAELQQEGGEIVPGVVMGNSFTSSGLTPSTVYSLQVAGVNNDGIGPFSSSQNLTTNG